MVRSVVVPRGVLCALFLSTAAAASGPACLPSNVISIWGGARHNIFLTADGTVWDLGYNWFGKLGDNTVSIPPDYLNDRHAPIAVHGPNDVGTLSSIIAIMGGESHNFALTSGGTVWAWGWNMFGQVGDGTYNDAHVPVQVSNLSNVVSLGGRGYHSLALDMNGDVWCWGLGTSGQLGDGNTSTSNVPLKVQGLGGPAAAVTGGYVTSFALMPDHTVRAWGGNGNGQLGNGSPAAYSATPVTVMGLANVAQISSGWKHVLAVTTTGDVYAWGLNLNHELGYGTMDSHVPAQVPGISNVVQVSGGDCHSAALKSDGTVWTWGCNDVGEIGDGTNMERPAPVQVMGLSNVVMIAARDYHNMALTADGSIWAWGSNNHGQLGDGTTMDRWAPILMVSGGPAVTAPPAVTVTQTVCP